MSGVRLGGAGALAAGLLGCLPADDRPVPASILVTAEPSEATKSGFTSADGWSVKLDRVLTALGDVDLDDPTQDSGTCASYSETHYEKLFDMVTVGREKVGLVYGLGDCSVEYRFRGPSEDALLGSGASKADAASMGARGSDAYAEDERVTLRIQGTIKKDERVERFDWSFRRSFEVSKCAKQDGGSLSVLELEGEVEHTLNVEVRGEELFRAGANDDAPIELERYVLADADADGEITFAELEAVALTDVDLERWPVEGTSEEDEPELPPATLGAFVYQLLLPRVTRMVGGAACEAEVRGRR